jgi:hypothetical protein
MTKPGDLTRGWRVEGGNTSLADCAPFELGKYPAAKIEGIISGRVSIPEFLILGEYAGPHATLDLGWPPVHRVPIVVKPTALTSLSSPQDHNWNRVN